MVNVETLKSALQHWTGIGAPSGAPSQATGTPLCR
jgi:hypothetical protein